MHGPFRHISVVTEDDIVAAIHTARAGGSRVRAVGSGGSKNGNYHTDGLALHLDRYRQIVAVQGNLVTVQAGLTCGELNERLAQLGLALPTMGEWKHATIAGALATAVHGGSSRHGILATSLRSIRLVTAAGRVVEVEREHEWFPHLGVSLGALGVISTATFQCQPGFLLGLERRAVSLDRYLQDYERENGENEFYSAVWFPGADSVITYAANRTTTRLRTGRRPQRYTLGTLLLHRLSRYLDLRTVLRARRLHSYTVGDAGEILTPIGVPPWLTRAAGQSSGMQEAEFAVPAERAAEAIALLGNLVRRHPGALANAIGLRATARDGFSLSPCSDRNTLWVSVFHRPGVPFVESLEGLFDGLEARCHWGKHVALSASQLSRRYPRKAAFLTLQAQLDPDNLFANPFTGHFGLTWSAGAPWDRATSTVAFRNQEDLCVQL